MATWSEIIVSAREGFGQARRELPRAGPARWAAVSFSLSVLTIAISLAASEALLAAAGVIYAAHLLGARPRVDFPPVKLPLALFALMTLVSVLAASHPGAGWFAVRKLVLFAILLFAVNLVKGLRHLEFLFAGLFFVSAVAGAVAAVQFVLKYRAYSALHPGNVYPYLASDRVTGFMGHWMNFGGQQMLVFAALVAFIMGGTRGLATRRGKWLGAAALAIIAASIVVNFTRGVWLGCLVALVYVMARSKPRWLWALPFVALAAALAAPALLRERVEMALHPSQDPSLSIRFEMWRAGLAMIRAHPWLGVGPNRIPAVYPLYLPAGKPPEVGYHEHLHNDFIQLGAERGLVALAAWIWLMGTFAWHTLRIRRRLAKAGGPRWIADAAFAAWLAFVVEGCFEFNFGTSPVLLMFLFVVSTPFAAAESARAGMVSTAGAEPSAGLRASS